ncbi:hypothetical protein ACA910_014510 [Epithemia clementina (nom. ined.)]
MAIEMVEEIGGDVELESTLSEVRPNRELPAEDNQERLRAKIRELLALCAENEVEVPIELKQALLGDEIEKECEPKHVLDIETERASLVREGEHKIVKMIRSHMEILHGELPLFDLRIEDGSFTVLVPDKANDPLYKNRSSHSSAGVSAHGSGHGSAHGGGATQHIPTIRNSNPLYMLGSTLLRCFRGGCNPKVPKKEKIIMGGVNLYFEPRKLYLVLGAPGSGKSTLLKMVAQKLNLDGGSTAGGKVTINGVAKDKEVVWNNLVGYIDQIDRLHPWMTVWETCEFAFKCRMGGTHRKSWYQSTEEANNLIEKLDKEKTMVNGVLEVLGLTRVKDTFVGDPKTVRGVSGGEKKRVTVAEMFCAGFPVMCCDEISTGLDAATTYDITRLLSQIVRVRNSTAIVSLLQPPPETVANFDELILISEGKIIYSGPVEDVLDHFRSLGYFLPDRMDVADWLQALPTPDGAAFLNEAKDSKFSMSDLRTRHLTTEEFSQKFYESQRGQDILEKLKTQYNEKDAEFVRSIAKDRYANTQTKSLGLVMRRELLLWRRDTYQIKQKLAQNTILALVIGTLFWQADVDSVIGVLFQSMFINVLGAMLLIVKQFPARAVFYKQQDANFFPTWTYVLGRCVANIPNALIDSLLYGAIVYWFVGLAYGNGASIAPFFMFLLILFMTSTATGLIFGMFPAIMEVVTLAQAAMAVVVLIMILFSGFTVQPDVRFFMLGDKGIEFFAASILLAILVYRSSLITGFGHTG